MLLSGSHSGSEYKFTAANLYVPLQSNFWGKGTLHPAGCKGVRRDHRPGSGPCPPRTAEGAVYCAERTVQLRAA